MRTRWMLASSAAAFLSAALLPQGTPHLNPMIDLLAAHKPVFGLYAPSNRRAPTRPGAPAPAPAATKSPAELAVEAMGQPASDYIFDGVMEHDFDGGYATFSQFVAGARGAGLLQTTPVKRLRYPLVVKTPEIAPDPAKARERIAKQLDLGVSTIVFVGAESAKEVEEGLKMMRYKAHGGTRPESVGDAPALWGMSEQEYREKADLWPLNPKGELVNWTIVESKEGLAHVREIAAVKGISVLFPGAGTLRGVFSSTDANGKRVTDEVAWEGAIQQVLAACKEFKVACGYPANLGDVEMRMKQGFSVFVIGWGDNGFKTVELGRKLAGRPATNAEEWR